MKFRYKKLAMDLFRPIIPIEIQHGDNALRYEVLIDSGADINVMNPEIAESLGIELKSGRVGRLVGVTGQAENCYIHQATIVVGGHKHEVEIGFAERLGQEGYGMLGQKGFFDLYKVKFDYIKQEIELAPHLKAKK